MPIDPISATLAAVQIGSSLLGGSMANKKAKQAAQLQTRLTGLQRKEEMRKARREADMEIGLGRAAVGASNVLFNGTSQDYINEMKNEYSKQFAYMKAADKLEQQAIMAGAKGAGDSLMIQGVGQALSFGISQALKPKTTTGE